MQSKWRCNPWLKRIIVLGSCTAVGAFLYWRFYYDKTYPRPAFTLQTGAVGSLSAAAISPDGALLLTTRRFSRNDCILVWQTVTWEQIGTLNGPSERITCVKFSRKGDLLGCSSKDGTVRLWDARTWEEITTLHHDNPVLGIDFSPDGHTLAAAVAYDNDCQLKVPERVGVDLWDLNNNAKSIRLPLEVEPASGVVFSNDGEYVAIGCIDGTVVIWDVTKEKKRLT